MVKRFVLALWISIFISCKIAPGYIEPEPKMKEITIVPKIYIEKLSDDLSENSGLMWYNNHLWTLNDSGGENEIYAVNADGQIENTVVFEGARNIDWESMTQDEDYIYAGDFGNNNGNRSDLKIYRISKDKIDLSAPVSSAPAETTYFFYADQDDYSLKQYNTEYDGEAMISYEDHLYIFTKDWVKGQTKVYELEKEPDVYEIAPLDSFQVNGLVTDADFTEDGNYLVLLGYKSNYTPFAYLFKFSPGKPFSSKSIYFDLTSLALTQPEGVCFKGDEIIISSENTEFKSQQVYSFNYTKYLDHFK